MLTETITLSPSITLTATETETGVDVRIERKGAIAWERSYDDHELVEAAVLAQDDAADVIAALKAAEKALKAHGRRLAKMADETEILKKGRPSEWKIYKRLLGAGVADPACNSIYDDAVAATNARRDAIPAERAAARKAEMDEVRATERATWDAKWGSLDAATAGYYREMGWMPARP